MKQLLQMNMLLQTIKLKKLTAKPIQIYSQTRLNQLNVVVEMQMMMMMMKVRITSKNNKVGKMKKVKIMLIRRATMTMGKKRNQKKVSYPMKTF
jgi:hypothetical protein